MKGRYISGPAAASILLFFFLPWIAVSCNGTRLGAFTGYQLARGVKTAAATSQSLPAAAWLLWLIPLAALLVLALLLWQNHAPAATGWGQVAATAVALGVLLWEWRRVSGAAPSAFEIVIEPALWGTVAAWGATLAGATLDLRAARQRRPASSQQSHPPPAAPQTASITPQQGAGHAPQTASISPQQGAGRAPQTASIPPQAHALPPRSPQTELLRPQTEFWPLAWLVISRGEQTGKHYRLRAATTLGRDPDCDVVLHDTAVSGRHARIQLEDGRLLLRDLNSTNGVFIFREAVWQPIRQVELQDGMQLKIGRTVFSLLTLADGQQAHEA